MDESHLELDCSRVKTFDDAAKWAIASFNFPTELENLPRTEIPGIFRSREIVNMDRFTTGLYHHIGKSGRSYSVKLKNYQAASKELLAVLNQPEGWRRAFGSGLPHDYGIGVAFEP